MGYLYSMMDWVDLTDPSLRLVYCNDDFYNPFLKGKGSLASAALIWMQSHTFSIWQRMGNGECVWHVFVSVIVSYNIVADNGDILL